MLEAFNTPLIVLLMLSLASAGVALAATPHPGFRRALLVLTVIFASLAFGLGAWRSSTADRAAEDAARELQSRQKSLDRAERDADLGRKRRELQRSFRQLDQALDDFTRGYPSSSAPPYELDSEPLEESAAVASARAELALAGRRAELVADSELQVRTTIAWVLAAYLTSLALIAAGLWVRKGFAEPAQDSAVLTARSEQSSTPVAIFGVVLAFSALACGTWWFSRNPRAGPEKSELTPPTLTASSRVPRQDEPRPINRVPPTPVVKSRPTTFSQPSLPGNVLRLQCRMDTCFWSQVRDIAEVRRTADEILFKVTGREGASDHRPSEEAIEAGTQYPDRFSDEIKIDWSPTTTYVLCSLTRPAVASPLQDENGFGVDWINPANLFGMNLAAGQLYMNVCHALPPHGWDEADVRRLRYRVRGDGKQEQIDAPSSLLN